MLDSYADHLRNNDLAPATIAAYLESVRHFIAWSQADDAFEPAGVTAQAIIRWRTKLVDQGKAANTINRRLAALRSYFTFLADTGAIPDDPARRIRNIEIVAAAPRCLTDKEESALLRAARLISLRNEHIVALLLHTGLRVSELCALRRSDIVIRERSGSITVRAGKGMKARTVPLNYDARQALAGLLDEGMQADAPLIAGRGGAAISVRAIEQMIARACRYAGVGPISPHDLRHRCVYRLRSAGVPDVQIAAIVGHESVTTTARYGRASAADLQRAMERLEMR